MTADPAALRRALADDLATSGSLTAPAWRSAVETVPREVFLGPAVFRPHGAAWEPVRRDRTSQDDWLRLAYSDLTRVTQVEGVDATGANGPVSGSPASSPTSRGRSGW
jgi:hypothetical protein